MGACEEGGLRYHLIRAPHIYLGRVSLLLWAKRSADGRHSPITRLWTEWSRVFGGKAYSFCLSTLASIEKNGKARILGTQSLLCPFFSHFFLSRKFSLYLGSAYSQHCTLYWLFMVAATCVISFVNTAQGAFEGGGASAFHI